MSLAGHNKSANAALSLTLSGGTDSCVLIAVGWYGSVSGSAPTDGTNTYTLVGSQITGSDTKFQSRVYKVERPTGGSYTVTPNFSAAPDIYGLLALEWKGCITSGTIVDQIATGKVDTHSDSTAYTSNTTGTTSQANEVAMTFVETFTNSGTTEALAWNNGYTPGDQNSDLSQWTSGCAYKVLNTTGTQQSSVNSSGAACSEMLLHLVTLKTQGSGTTIDADAGTDTISLTDSVTVTKGKLLVAYSSVTF